VVEARDWEHGVYLGATISSEQTAAAEGTVGTLRRDPFAMLPFCGYNMADYWEHWLEMGQKLRATSTVPRIFQVNWFRKDENGRFLWPGFGENSRVLEWILNRVDAHAPSVESPLGLVPSPGGLNLEGLDLSDSDFEKLFHVDPTSWLAEVDSTEEFFATFGGRVPEALTRQLTHLRERLTEAKDSEQTDTEQKETAPQS
jgi:phosphoenolpyruvate carboxykinase (GTP)